VGLAPASFELCQDTKLITRPIPPLDTLEHQLMALLRDRLLEPSAPFDPATDLYSLGMDSMGIMQLLILIEEEYGVALPECALTRRNFTTVQQIARLIQAQGGTPAA
jgi:acyl carrier protein